MTSEMVPLNDGGEIAVDSASVCLVDSHHGIYVPQVFTAKFDAKTWGVKFEDWKILRAGPDHTDYWDAWADVLCYASHTDKDGIEWFLDQDCDLFAKRADVDWSEEPFTDIDFEPGEAREFHAREAANRPR